MNLPSAPRLTNIAKYMSVSARTKFVDRHDVGHRANPPFGQGRAGAPDGRPGPYSPGIVRAEITLHG